MPDVICELPKDTNWRILYRAAVLEPDASQIPVRIELAKNAIVLRARELFQKADSNLAEQQALDAALSYLHVLNHTLRQSPLIGGHDGKGGPLKAA
jgi:hypothetical protein